MVPLTFCELVIRADGKLFFFLLMLESSLVKIANMFISNITLVS